MFNIFGPPRRALAKTAPARPSPRPPVMFSRAGRPAQSASGLERFDPAVVLNAMWRRRFHGCSTKTPHRRGRLAGCVHAALRASNTILDFRPRVAPPGVSTARPVFQFPKFAAWLHLTIRSPEIRWSKAKSTSPHPNARHPATANPRFNQLWKRYNKTLQRCDQWGPWASSEVAGPPSLHIGLGRKRSPSPQRVCRVPCC